MTTYHYTRIHKISPFGNVLWSKTLTGDDLVQKKSISVESSGAFVVQAKGNQIIAFSPVGEELWDISDTDGVERIRSFVIGPDGYVYLTYNTDLVPEVINGDVMWTTYFKTLKIDASGNIIWTHTSEKNIF